MLTWLGYGLKIFILFMEQLKNKREKDALKRKKKEGYLDDAKTAIDAGDFAGINRAIDRLWQD